MARPPFRPKSAIWSKLFTAKCSQSEQFEKKKAYSSQVGTCRQRPKMEILHKVQFWMKRGPSGSPTNWSSFQSHHITH